MNNDANNVMPDIPGAAPDLLRDRKWYGTDTSGLLLSFSKPYTPPKWTLQHKGINFAKRGDLLIVGGKAGHGKSAFMSQIMAAILCGQFGSTKCVIQNEAPVVLYIDTEQSEDDTIAIKNRVCLLANMDYTKDNDRFKVARLRDTTQPLDRYKQILQLIWDIKPTVVFIDGLLDIVHDYNDQEECSLIIRELMAVSTALNISMWCVLHENPMTDKLVGSLGSIAERKVTDVFIIRKHKGPHQDKRYKDYPNVFFEVKQTKARGKDQEDWYFTIEDKNLGWGVPIEFGYDEKDDDLPFKPEQIQQWITDRQKDLEWPAGRRDIERAILTPYGVTDESEQKAAIDIAINRRFLLKQSKADMAPGQKTPKLIINEEIIKPF